MSELRPAENQVVLSDGRDLMADQVWGTDWNPLAPLPQGQAVTVRLRHSKTETPAHLTLGQDGPRLNLLRQFRLIKFLTGRKSRRGQQYSQRK